MKKKRNKKMNVSNSRSDSSHYTKVSICDDFKGRPFQVKKKICVRHWLSMFLAFCVREREDAVAVAAGRKSQSVHRYGIAPKQIDFTFESDENENRNERNATTIDKNTRMVGRWSRRSTVVAWCARASPPQKIRNRSEFNQIFKARTQRQSIK